MTSLSVDISDDLTMPREQVRASSWMSLGAAQIAWDEIDWDAHIENPLEPKKVGKIKAFFKYIGRSKPISIGDENDD